MHCWVSPHLYERFGGWGYTFRRVGMTSTQHQVPLESHTGGAWFQTRSPTFRFPIIEFPLLQAIQFVLHLAFIELNLIGIR